MFRNPGEKVKGFAEIICILGIIASIITGLVMISNGAQAYRGGEAMITTGVIVMIAGSLASWLSALGLYAFGQLVVRVESIDRRLANIDAMTNPVSDPPLTSTPMGPASEELDGNQWRCPECGEINPQTAAYCHKCLKYRPQEQKGPSQSF